MIAVFATYVLGYIGSRKMKVFLLGIGVCIHMQFTRFKSWNY
jgi:hypothetical protein